MTFRTSRLLAAFLALTLTPAILLAQTPAPQIPVQSTRIPIAPLLAKYNSPVLSADMLDADHILLRVFGKCPTGLYPCDAGYLMADRSGKLLASLPTEGTIKPLADGNLLLNEWSKGLLTVLDKNLAVVATYPCDKPCRGVLPTTYHLAPYAIVAGTYCYTPRQCQSEAKESPLFAKALALGARYVLPVSPDEFWYLDKKSRAFYLTAAGTPTLIPGSKASTLPIDRSSFQLYTLGRPRILSISRGNIPLYLAMTNIDLRSNVAVYDVLSHSTIARKTGSDYFLSLDGKTLGHLEHNKFIELEPLP